MSHFLDGNAAILTLAFGVVAWCGAIVSYAIVTTRKRYRELGLATRGIERP